MKALLLAAGMGTRLHALTQRVPKPLLPVKEEPLIAHSLRYLGHHGFRDVAVNLHNRPEMFRSVVGDGSRFGVRVTFSLERELLGTAGTVRNLSGFFEGEDPFLVMYGDILTDQDLELMVRFHHEKGADLTLLVHWRERSNSVVEMDEQGRLTKFVERPGEDRRPAAAGHWTNSGIQLLSPLALELVVSSGGSDLPRDVYPEAVKSLNARGLPISGYRCAIDSEDRYAQACRDAEAGKCRLYSGPGGGT